MAIVFVQARTAGNQVGPSVDLAFTSALTYGNTGFVCLGYTQNGIFCTSVDDDIGNSYTLLNRYSGTQRVSEIWIANGLVAGSATVSAHFPTAKSGIGIALLEYAHTVGFIFALDQQNQAQSLVVVGSFPHGSITTTVADELILTAAHIQQLVNAPAGYTARANSAGGGTVTVLERIVSATETTNPTPTTAGSNTQYNALVVSLSEIVDTSGLQLTQQAREVLEDESVPTIRLTQMAREILYPFTCVPGPAPSVPGCPAIIPLLPVTGEPGCADEV